MKFKPPPKQKKLDSAPSPSPSYYTHDVVPAKKREVDLTHVKKSMVVEIQPSNVELKIQQAKCFAAAQAQQDCCTGNFKNIRLAIWELSRPRYSNPYRTLWMSLCSFSFRYS
ncbi:hypothetical protein ABFX02_02G059750 [Erythranthe guttata]